MREKIVQHYSTKWRYSLRTLSYISLYDLPTKSFLWFSRKVSAVALFGGLLSYFIRKNCADDGGLFLSKPLPLLWCTVWEKTT